MANPNPDNINHDKQEKALCALHTLNNLFQYNHESSIRFTQADLDSICSGLAPNSWMNPHKSILGIGNYDINVIMRALQSRNYEAIWFDKRKDPSVSLNLSQIYGFILNLPSDSKLSWFPFFNRRHWIAIPKIDNKYYNLDSKLNEPYCIGGEPELLSYLQKELQCNDKELFLVVTQAVASSQGWSTSNPGRQEGSGESSSSGNVSNSENNGTLSSSPASSSISSSTHNHANSISSSLSLSNSSCSQSQLAQEQSSQPPKQTERKQSTDSGVVELLDKDLFKEVSSIDIVDLGRDDDEEELH